MPSWDLGLPGVHQPAKWCLVCSTGRQWDNGEQKSLDHSSGRQTVVPEEAGSAGLLGWAAEGNPTLGHSPSSPEPSTRFREPGCVFFLPTFPRRDAAPAAPQAMGTGPKCSEACPPLSPHVAFTHRVRHRRFRPEWTPCLFTPVILQETCS